MSGTSIKTGRHAIIEQFLADGMDHMFGNPGTVEQGFLDALADYPEMKYVLTLQESIAVMAADGHARATKKPALVQIHSSPGLGNAIGALYQAKRGHAPLVVIGGDSGVKYLSMDAQMAGDLVAFAEPVTKYATCVYDSSSLLRVLRRAIKIASTPPMGPVYICLPMDILDQPVVEEVYPTFIPSTRVSPDLDTVEQAATMLAEAETPIILMGDGIAYSQAQNELVQVAEQLCAPVWEANNGELNMDTTHPLFQGSTGHMFGSQSLPILKSADAVLVVGTYILPEVFPELGNVFSPDTKVIHFDLDAYEIAKNHPVTLGVVSDPKRSLSLLADCLERTLSDTKKQSAQQSLEHYRKSKEKQIAEQFAKDKEVRDITPLFMSRFMETLAPKLDENTIIFDEALTNSPPITRYFPPTRAEHYFVIRGGSLGLGFPGAIGIKLANPDKTVLGFSGDGGCMYTIQALWTAVRHKVSAKFIVCNNLSYRLLQLNIGAYWNEQEIPQHSFPLPFDLSYPRIDFVGLAQAMGVEAMAVKTVDDIEPAIEKMLSSDRPFLIDLHLENDTHPEQIPGSCSA
jgi:thiamine pyrophosphate-dependent acetolactate synthase large subunit-like protein